MTPAERIDLILKERNLSRRQVAIKAKIPPSSFQSAMERNKNLSIDMLQKISEALDVSIFDLMGVDESDGFVTFSIPAELAQKIGLPEINEGTIVAGLEPGSAAANALANHLLGNYSKLNDEGKRVAADRVQELTEIPKYQLKPEDK